MFTNYTKETGPWHNASKDDGGTDEITVIFDSVLLSVELLVGLYSGVNQSYLPHTEWTRANIAIHTSLAHGKLNMSIVKMKCPLEYLIKICISSIGTILTLRGTRPNMGVARVWSCRVRSSGGQM